MTTEPMAGTGAGMRTRSSAQTAATFAAVIFVVAGIAGWIPGITTHLYGGLKFAGDKGNAELIGIFKVSWLHNIVHLGFGLVGLALARTWSGARTYLLGGGVIYLALWLLGLFGGADWIPSNNPDDWLHFALGVGLIGLGLATTRGAAATTAAAA